MYSLLQTLWSHFVQVGAVVHAKRLRLLEKLNESRVRNFRTQATLQLRENQYQDLKSRFPLVVEEAEVLKRKLSEAVVPLELTQRNNNLEAQVAAQVEAYAKLSAELRAKAEAYAKLSTELEAVHAAHLRDVALLEDALKEKKQ